MNQGTKTDGKRFPLGAISRLASLCFSAVLLLMVACFGLGTQSAYADVRQTDNLNGITVENRGLSTALCPNLDANNAILVTGDGKVYFEREADERVHIASVTKIMTAIVALEFAPLDTVVVVTNEAASVGESSAGLQSGDSMTLESALNGLLVSSGNDAAISIADTLGALMIERVEQSANGSDAEPLPSMLSNVDPAMSNVEAFVSAMNAKAVELGMTNSLFSNPHGLDIGKYDAEMYSSARDVAIMSAHAMDNEVFRNIVGQEGVAIAVTKADGSPSTVELKSTDRLIGSYEGACGIKTGYTEAAGYCFAGACQRDGEYLYSIVLGSSSEFVRFDDAKALYEWYYGNWVDYQLAQSEIIVPVTMDDVTSEVPIVAEVSHKSWLDKTVRVTLEDPTATVRVFAFDGNISQKVEFEDVKGNVKVGEKVGTITYYQHNEVVATANMVAAEASPAPNPIEALKIAWDRIWLGVKGEPDCAQSVILNETPLIYDKNLNAA